MERLLESAIQVANDDLMWYVIIHLTFVLSAFGMGIWGRLILNEEPPPTGP